MKNLIILLLIISPVFYSCRNTSINGKLDGMWQLMTIENNGEAGIDTKENRIYYNIKLNLIHLQQANGIDYLGRFTQTEDSLFVYDFVLNGNNSIKATAEDLEPFGIYNIYEHFGIESMTNKKMILRSKNALLTFRKY